MDELVALHNLLQNLRKTLETFQAIDLQDSVLNQIRLHQFNKGQYSPSQISPDSLPRLEEKDYFLVDPLLQAINATLERLNGEIGQWWHENFPDNDPNPIDDEPHDWNWDNPSGAWE